jgi:hypothetical protein
LNELFQETEDSIGYYWGCKWIEGRKILNSFSIGEKW